MSLSCGCVRPFLDLIQVPDRLKAAVAERDVDGFRDAVRDAINNVNMAERECGVAVPEHVKRHLKAAEEMSRRERTITTGMQYQAEEGINDAIFELKHSLYARCKP